MRNSRTLEWILAPRAASPGVKPGDAPAPKLPRVARLMALAIKLDGLIREGVVRDYADIAKLGLVSRARVTQIMNLLNLAPDIQEQLLFLNAAGPPVAERHLRRLTRSVLWEDQRRAWREMLRYNSAADE